jgi:hypothetical protein
MHSRKLFVHNIVFILSTYQASPCMRCRLLATILEQPNFVGYYYVVHVHAGFARAVAQDSIAAQTKLNFQIFNLARFDCSISGLVVFEFEDYHLYGAEILIRVRIIIALFLFHNNYVLR